MRGSRRPTVDGGSPAGGYGWALWSVAAAFGTYFCMYAFRKPFTAAAFDGPAAGGMHFKTLLVITQVGGYMVSKFLGIRFVSELPARRRAAAIVALIGAAELALLLFGLTPRPWSAVWLFFNGLALGMVFGLVLSFLEGRQLTEALAAGLCASFIVAGGVVQSVGSWLLSRGVSEHWMPFFTGALFALPTLGFVWMLSRTRPPTRRDMEERTRRVAMSRDDRWSLLGRHAPGLAPLVVIYLLITVVRSLRADFAPEIWRGLGHSAAPGVFARSETLVAVAVLIGAGLGSRIRDNRKAFFRALATCSLGFPIMAAALLARSAGVLDAFPFMVLVGAGMYLPYVLIHTTVFERMLAVTRDQANVAFLLYVADAIGYLGYVAVMIARELVSGGDLLRWFVASCWLTIAAAAICLGATWLHFARHPAAAPAETA